MLLGKIDVLTGMFVEDILLESIPIDEEGIPDPQYIAKPVPQGFYWPKWNGTEWVEGGTASELQPATPSEVEILQAQVKASDDRADFLEECLVEMAQLVYK
ncbi:hypothetical protein [Planococcus citreus]|uniref:Uncharacterized protein n=1 Tax=Planococcus citreus TaxID=1373 RepID=A0A497YP50_9BACL|nr:hypothetical protein [Planococcus citreus]RLJ90113.1 hypothetical protein DFR62_0255 [Planococcus citreus]